MHPHHRGDRPQLPPGAGFIRRVLATGLDVLLFIAVAIPMARPLASRLAALGPQPPAELAVSVMASPSLRHLALITLVVIAFIWWAYVIVGWGVFGATLGKRLMGLAVIDHCGRHPIGVARAQLRLTAYTLSSLALGGGHLLVALRSDHRALHDMLAGTRVVRRRDLRCLPIGTNSAERETLQGPSKPSGPTPTTPIDGDD